MCKSRKDLCIYSSRIACQICNQCKIRCSFLDGRWKRKNNEIDSKEDEEPTPKKPRSGVSKLLAMKPIVKISGPILATNGSLVIEMVGLLRELVEGVQDLMKVTRGVAGLGTQIYQQNAKLIRLGERQSYLAEKSMKTGLGLGSEAGELGVEEVRRDKGKGKAKMTEEKDEMMRSNGDSDSDSDEEEEEDVRQNEDVGGTVLGSDKEE
jgi:hypothetical protein